MKLNEQWMQKNIVVWIGALLCCALWGSAFPCVKIGYRLFEIASEDVATQILFAGCRFTLAVFSRWSDHDHLRTFVWRMFSDSFRKRHGNACLSGTCFGGSIFPVGDPVKIQSGFKSRSVWLYEPGVWCDLIRIIAE